MNKRKVSLDNQEVIEEEVIKEAEKPPMYTVVLLNDDYTPMDFVIDILRKYFNMNEDKAIDVMLEIHYKGKGRCGTYTAEIAEMKKNQVCNYALEKQHPLKCSMEKS